MEPHEERRLTTILSADVVGYSRLMAADEAGTHARLKAHNKELLDPKAAEYHGRTVKMTGDGALMEFASVVNAVRFAADVQRAMIGRNAAVPKDRQITFRIGINTGDVIAEDDDIHGNGVNVAVRLEGLADPGGICVSGKVYEEVKDKLQLGMEDLGEQQLKNIPGPVRVYRVLADPASTGALLAPKRVGGRPRWRAAAAAAAVAVALVSAGAVVTWLRPWEPTVETASIDRMAFPLPDKASIAVLPFENLSGDPDQEYLSDAITEDIITVLAGLPELFVIARNSTFTYKGKAVKVQEVAEALGVRYVLEGSVQRSGERIRVTAQLVDALTGHHLWSERYERTLNDVFALQDEITLNVVTNLHIELSPYGRAGVARRETPNLRAWLLLAQSLEYAYRFTKEDNVRAQQMLEEALELDPTYTHAYVVLAWRYWQAARNGWADNSAAAFKKANELAEKARSLDELNPNVYILLTGINLSNRAYDEAIAAAERAISLGPNNSEAFAALGWALNEAMQPKEAIPHFKTAMRLGPYYPNWYLDELADAYRLAEQYDEAIAAYEKLLARDPGLTTVVTAHCDLAVIYAEIGNEDKARSEVAKAIAAAPSVTVDHLRSRSLKKDMAFLERYFATLQRLGLPE